MSEAAQVNYAKSCTGGMSGLFKVKVTGEKTN